MHDLNNTNDRLSIPFLAAFLLQNCITLGCDDDVLLYELSAMISTNFTFNFDLIIPKIP